MNKEAAPQPPQSDGRGKRALREYYMSVRRQFPGHLRGAADVAIGGHALRLLRQLDQDVQEPSHAVGLYHSFRGEVDLSAFARDVRTEGWTTAYPISFPETKTMVFREVDDETKWVHGAYGIWEPPSSAQALDAGALFAVFVPGVAFTRTGGRLGYGGGYYDRLFAHTAPGVIRIGVAYTCQIAEMLPLSPHDVLMHYVITEEGVLSCGSAPSC